ncbi:uncharacterized protein [Amphiura filiformis]|uniref:uncharacterized protein isoform X2 n=1 Tax=Amphiura filiformis TaxID=82378 RepID=UPI003B212A6B
MEAKLRPKPPGACTMERPVTFAEFGLDMKPYFTTYKDRDRPSTFAHFGVDVEREKPIVKSFVGPYRKWSNIDRKEKVFLTTTLLGLLIILGLTVDRLAIINSATDDFTFALLLLVNTVFCIYYVIHSILREHPHELFVFAFSLTALIVYCIANFAETIEMDFSHVKLIRLIVVCLIGPFSISLGIYIGIKYMRSRRVIFRTVGANIHLQDLCGNMYFFSDLIKFDLQLQTSMLILVLDDGTNSNVYEKVVMGLGLPLGIIWHIIGFLSIRFENKILVTIFLLACWVLPVYTTYKFIDLCTRWPTFLTKADKLLPSCIIVCGILSILTRVFLVVIVLYLSMNFGHNLGEKVFGGKSAGSVSSIKIRTLSRTRRSFLNRRPVSWPRVARFKSSRRSRDDMRQQLTRTETVDVLL